MKHVGIILAFLLVPVVASGGPALASIGGPVPTRLDPQYEPEETLQFDGAVYGGFAVTGQYEYHAAVRFTPEKPCSVRAVIFYQYDASAEDGRVYVYGANSRTRPGDRLASAFYPGAGARQWKRVDFARPAAVDSGTDFWTCVTTTHFTHDHPLAVDRGPLVRYRGGFIKVPLMGETWYQLSDAPFYESRNWNQRAIVVFGTGIEEELGPSGPPAPPRPPTVARGSLLLSSGFALLDISGRKVMDLAPGENDVSTLAPGVYFVRSAEGRGSSALSVSRVILTR